jgi:gliding motility-associated lipoprotein GldD
MMRNFLIALFLIASLFSSCGSDYTPKPRGYFKIDLPDNKYQNYSSNCPFTFDFSIYSTVLPDKNGEANPCWMDIYYPQFNGRVHLSYQSFSNRRQFDALVEDARTFAFKHTVKATAIDEAIISYPEKKVYGIYYSIDGNTASSVQFFLTDSTKNYLRGALYFNEQPRLDSIQPALDFIKKDIDHMIKTFKWQK